MKYIYGIMAVLFLMGCQEATPAVQGIDPVFGLTRGDDKVTISGEGLDRLAPLTVYFGSSRSYATGGVTADGMWAQTPPASEQGLVDVRIIGADGTEFVIEKGFEYVQSAKMAKCINVGRALNGEEVVPKKSKRSSEADTR